MPEGRTLRLLFGDFDVESSPGCSNGSIVITDKSGERSLGEWSHTLLEGLASRTCVLMSLC